LGFDEKQGGAGFGFQGVGFVGAEHSAHAAGEIDSGAGGGGFYGHSAVDNQDRGGVGDGGCFDFAAHFEVKAAD